MDFTSLKRSSQSDFDALKKKVNETASGGGGQQGEDHFWKPDVDASGNGYAVIRFLPAAPEEDLPYVQV